MKSINLLKSVIQLIENNDEALDTDYRSLMCATRGMLYNKSFKPHKEFEFLNSHDLCENIDCDECIFYPRNKQKVIDTLNKLIPIIQLEEMIK